MCRKEMEILHHKISELESANQYSENLSIEQRRQIEYESENKDREIKTLQTELREKQAEHREKLSQIEEELEIERENGI